MKSCSIIIQGEGRGHFSQALVFYQQMEEKGVEVKRIFVGRSIGKRQSAYFKSAFPQKIIQFYSPNFIDSSSRRGIRIGVSIFINILLSPLFIFEVIRLSFLLRIGGGEYLYNFYDVVGALAGKFAKRRKHVVSISHHFYFSHPDFLHPYGFDSQRFWLLFMNRFFIRNSGKIWALSFRKGKKHGKIEPIEPLIDSRVRELNYAQGERDLCYFLKEGYVRDAVDLYREHSELKADLFTDYDIEDVPDNVKIHSISREQFLQHMQSCKRIITSGGFDTVAEAFHLGIPIFLLPTENHYEQYCNALDASRTGKAFMMEEMSELIYL